MGKINSGSNNIQLKTNRKVFIIIGVVVLVVILVIVGIVIAVVVSNNNKAKDQKDLEDSTDPKEPIVYTELDSNPKWSNRDIIFCGRNNTLAKQLSKLGSSKYICKSASFGGKHPYTNIMDQKDGSKVVDRMDLARIDCNKAGGYFGSCDWPPNSERPGVNGCDLGPMTCIVEKKTK